MSLPHDALRQELASMYGEHHGWLRGWLRKKLGDGHLAADLAHDTFMRLLCRQDVVAAQEPRAFLLTVAQRVLSNRHRRQKLEQAYLAALSHQPESHALSAQDRAILLETLTQIDQLLDGLPRVAKRAFLLSQLDGLTHTEIAAQLAISVSSVKRYIARAAYQCYFVDAAAPH